MSDSEASAPSWPSRELPLPASWTVRDARDAYLEENGFTVGGYDDPWTQASFFGFSFKIPNTKRHRTAIMLHDLHHVACGYGTDLPGEAEISAWEVRHGLRGLGLYVGAIVLGGAAFGLVIAPRRTLRAFRHGVGGVGAGGSLFQTTRRYEELLAMRVGELRAMLSVPVEGLAKAPRALHPLAPRALAHG